MRNPHLDRTLGHEANRSFTQGWKQGWGDRRPPAQTIWKANPHQGERAIGRNPFKWNFDSGRQGLENWKREQEGPNIMNPLNDQASYVPSERVYPRFVIDDLLKQGVTFPDELRQIGSDSWQITPRGMDPKPLRPSAYYTMNKGLDNWGGNLGGTFNQPGYGDPSSGYDKWGQDWDYDYDDFYPDVLYPGMEGPLSFT